MKIKNVMSTELEIVSPETFLHEVAQKMRKADNGCVIVAEGNRLLGIITDRDIAIRCVAEAHHSEETAARHIMTPEILYCQEDDDAEAVARNMANESGGFQRKL